MVKAGVVSGAHRYQSCARPQNECGDRDDASKLGDERRRAERGSMETINDRMMCWFGIGACGGIRYKLCELGQSRNRREFLDDTEQYNTTVVLYTDSKTPKCGEQQAITAMWRNVFG